MTEQRLFDAAVAELVDAHVSGACIREDVGVRLSPAALFIENVLCLRYKEFGSRLHLRRNDQQPGSED